jgi:hypothetical protein
MHTALKASKGLCQTLSGESSRAVAVPELGGQWHSTSEEEARRLDGSTVAQNGSPTEAPPRVDFWPQVTVRSTARAELAAGCGT